MNELAKYLINNIYLDFQGGITLEEMRASLRKDDTRESRHLLSKLIEDKCVDDLLVTIADCLKESLRSGINEDTIKEQLVTYAES
ncbi:MAG: hypothetical protein GXP55_26000 [Deltaproteobacteria bacterium]|nr:hypothetical protein [Deltaproteobacteria bacterium]